MTQSAATTQISCQVEAPIDYPVQRQGYSSRIQKINFDTSNSSGRRYCHHKNPQNNSSNAEERSRTDSFKSRPHNRTSSFQKNKTPTLIPVPLLDKAKPFLGNKRLDDTGKYNDPNLSNHQNSAKIYGKDSDRCSSMYCSSRMLYLKRSFYQKYFTHDTSIDMPCCYSSELVNSSTNFLAADGIFREKYQRSITKISISMQKSDSSPSLQSDSGKFPSLAISLKKEKNRIKSRTNTLPRNSQPQSFIDWQYTIHGNISVGTQYPFINPSARFEYRSQIPKLNPSGKKGFVHSSVSHESVLIQSELDSRKMVQTKAQTYDAKTLTKEAESLFPTISSKNRQIYTTKPNSFWCGRFTALHDRFHNDMLETLVIDRKTYTRFQDGTLPSSRTVSTLNDSDSPETTAGLQYLNDEETRRCKKSFIHLGALCVTDEAKKSLWNFQLAYARSQGKKQLLPIGGQMDPDVNQEREI
ncbi:hypothetical protein OnM2_051015 [Erysiphe neolycopersici]|uniref:Uncharacterized protein n=1 Tax=Erysiphe neolycopersici TaxID=212602 RepID=A0A420HSV4_9PEZI|nr:hypothetical protein OnM2_051015 [Erysiphe neolycopersici]